MRKVHSLILFFALSISIFLLTIPLFEAKANYIYIKPEFTHSFTKAFCTESNLCEDYLIECQGDFISKMTPTGFAVQFSDDWKDPRSKSEIEKFC